MLSRQAVIDDAEGCVQVMVTAMSASSDYNHPKPEDITDHWRERISGYMAGTYHPGFALEDRVVFIAEQSGQIIGFIAGHKTLRFGCDGELQWAFVLPDWQNKGVASSLLAMLRKWFEKRGLKKVCVNASVDMETRAFYLKQGATPTNDHWCVWESISKS